MPSQEQLIRQLLQTIDDATGDFNSKIPSLQQAIFDDIVLLVKDLDITSDGTIKNNVTNLKTIGKIKSKIEAIVLNDDYLDEVKKFTDTFNEVAKIQNEYFKLIEKKFSPSKLLKEIQRQSVDATIESLTESGLDHNVTTAIKEILRTNITSGGSYKDLTTQLRSTIISDKTGAGLLEKYAKTYTTDSIMTFNRQYSHTISDDLNLTWYRYTGSNITTTREWCEFLTKKKFVNKKELPELLKGNIDGHQCKMSKKTGLWLGAKENTTIHNILDNAGGWNCQHIFQPISEIGVPENIRAKFK